MLQVNPAPRAAESVIPPAGAEVIRQAADRATVDPRVNAALTCNRKSAPIPHLGAQKECRYEQIDRGRSCSCSV